MIWLFPENQQAWDLFEAVRTQWRTGMAGPTGLDYQVIPTVLQLRGIPRRQWKDLFEDIRTMEFAVLELQAENRQQG